MISWKKDWWYNCKGSTRLADIEGKTVLSEWFLRFILSVLVVKLKNLKIGTVMNGVGPSKSGLYLRIAIL